MAYVYNPSDFDDEAGAGIGVKVRKVKSAHDVYDIKQARHTKRG